MTFYGTGDDSQTLQTPVNLTRCIIIRIYRIKEKERRHRNRHRQREATGNKEALENLDTNLEVSEKAKMLNTHMISFGHKTLKCTRPSGEKRDASYKLIDADDTPFFTFKFFYGPREFLRAQGVIPPDEGREHEVVSPPRLDEDGNTSAVLKELEHRKAEAARQQEELQREIDRLRGPGRSKVKSESRPDASLPFNSGEVIDLTSD